MNPFDNYTRPSPEETEPVHNEEEQLFPQMQLWQSPLQPDERDYWFVHKTRQIIESIKTVSLAGLFLWLLIGVIFLSFPVIKGIKEFSEWLWRIIG